MWIRWWRRRCALPLSALGPHIGTLALDPRLAEADTWTTSRPQGSDGVGKTSASGHVVELITGCPPEQPDISQIINAKCIGTAPDCGYAKSYSGIAAKCGACSSLGAGWVCARTALELPLYQAQLSGAHSHPVLVGYDNWLSDDDNARTDINTGTQIFTPGSTCGDECLWGGYKAICVKYAPPPPPSPAFFVAAEWSFVCGCGCQTAVEEALSWKTTSTDTISKAVMKGFSTKAGVKLSAFGQSFGASETQTKDVTNTVMAAIANSNGKSESQTITTQMCDGRLWKWVISFSVNGENQTVETTYTACVPCQSGGTPPLCMPTNWGGTKCI